VTDEPGRLEFVIVTGLSGAGKSIALRTFEDIGFFCMDNLPPALLPKFAELLIGSKDQPRRVAAVCDVRSSNISDELQAALRVLSNLETIHPLLVFLDCDTPVLLRRFSETRRKHPLGAASGLEQSVERERQMMSELKERSDVFIDTSALSLREFQEKLVGFFSPESRPRLLVFLTSFGYKFGLPASSDIVLDVRFLPNPFYEPALSNKTGLDPEVAEFVLRSDPAAAFLEKTGDWLSFLIPRFIAEGKSHLGIAVGCTGGRHRSVVISERLRRFLTDTFAADASVTVSLVHRDIGK